MGNSLRCCLACVLPCGALDVIRIVHLSGQVEELGRPVAAGEILKANPDHVLTKPTCQGVVHRIVILSPESELKRGNIYFLIPVSSVLENKRGPMHNKIGSSKRSITKEVHHLSEIHEVNLRKILSETKSSHRDRRSRKVNVWRSHLESITEDL